MKTISWLIPLAVIVLGAVIIFLAKPQDDQVPSTPLVESMTEAASTSPIPAVKAPDIQFTLRTLTEGGKLLFQGVGGDIDGIVNPDLIVQPGAVVKIILINADGMPHNLYLPDFEAKTSFVAKIGDQTEIVFEVADTQPDSYVYYCEVPGHRQAGQEGKLIVQDGFE